MRRTMTKAAFHTALNLLFFATLGTALLGWTYNLTHGIIAQSEDREKLKLIAQIVPASSYDNDIVKDSVALAADELLGLKTPGTLYRGRLGGEVSVVVLQAVAPDGYSGAINLVVAVRRDGTLGGVRVVSHKETPGLGDYIDAAKSDWITAFTGRALGDPAETEWKVKKDGGVFDYRAGATVTPRAIVKAVRKTLQYAAQHHDELFGAATGEKTP